MKKRYIVIGSLAFMQLFAKAQSQDSTSRKVLKTDIEFVYNQYFQDGNNSAVTGGTGTERLTVYGPSLAYRRTSERSALRIHGGVDVITSASTDNIDFVVSSASKTDPRGYLTGEWERNYNDLSIHAGAGISIESDYLSLSGKVGLTRSSSDNLRTLSIDFQYFNDDLRWGIFTHDSNDPKTLIYPVELRGTDWFDIYKRHSYNLKLGLIQVINARTILGLFPELTYQHGLLSTPFHRVYFSDDAEAVENLPQERTKAALAIRLNSFAGSFVIVRNTANLYHDSFGIWGASFENETIFKVSPFFSIVPGFRIYTQSEAEAFAPYKEHDPFATYYTSDYDLSAFQTYSGSLGFKVRRLQETRHGRRTRSITLRYQFIHRTAQLNAHALSLAILWESFRQHPDENTMK